MTQEIIYITLFVLGALFAALDLRSIYQQRRSGDMSRNYYISIALLVVFVGCIAEQLLGLTD